MSLYLLSLIISFLLLLSCSPRVSKLEGVNYIDIVRVEDKISISYYRDNPLKPSKRVDKKRYRVICSVGSSPIALWVWNHRDIKKDWETFDRVVKEFGIVRVYLQVSSEIDKNFVQALKNRGLEVFLLDGGKEVSLNFSPEYIKELSPDGFQIDIEPYLNWDFKLKQERYLGNYVKLLKALKRELKPIKLSVVVPFWFDSLTYRGKPLINYVFTYADEVVVMAYRNSLSKAVELVGEEIDLAKRYRKELWLGVELHPQKDEHHNIYRVGRYRLERVGGFKVRGSMLVMPYKEAVRLKFIKCKNVRGFVVHSYSYIKKLKVNSVK